MNDAFYTRNLPHWHPAAAILFLTWWLFGSLPALQRTARNGRATKDPKKSAGEEFMQMDRLLDRSRVGPAWLKNPEIADTFIRLLRRGSEELRYFGLLAYCVMPNHIHLVIAPKIALRRITNGIKGATARAANLFLGRTGKPFWQDESYDHWIRNERELGRICAYVEYNPVSAGLVTRPEAWPWSSAKEHLACSIPVSAKTLPINILDEHVISLSTSSAVPYCCGTAILAVLFRPRTPVTPGSFPDLQSPERAAFCLLFVHMICCAYSAEIVLLHLASGRGNP